jgi:hypothetical protein
MLPATLPAAEAVSTRAEAVSTIVVTAALRRYQITRRRIARLGLVRPVRAR